MNKENIIKELEIRVEFMVNDCRTFYSAKTCNNNCCVGGGNFLSILGSFSIINLLAKVNYIVNGGEIWGQEERKAIQKLKGKIKPEEAKEFFKTPRKYEPKETEENCFLSLFKDTEADIPWGFKDINEAKLVWLSYRNKLAHIASPSLPAAALCSDKIKGGNFKLLMASIHDTNRNIYDDHSKSCPIKVISAEKINEHIYDIWSIVKEKINICKDDRSTKAIEQLLFN